MKRQNPFVSNKIEVSDTHNMLRGSRPKAQAKPRPKKPSWPKHFGPFHLYKKGEDEYSLIFSLDTEAMDDETILVAKIGVIIGLAIYIILSSVQ